MKVSIGSKFAAAAAVFLCLAAPLSAQAAESYGSVKKDNINIRSGPGADKEALWIVFKDFPLQIVQKKGDWTQIKDFEGESGWINNTMLDLKKKTVIVKAKTANMRVGPGQNYELVATVKYGVVFEPVCKDGDWYKLKHEDGTVGWIKKDFIWPN